MRKYGLIGYPLGHSFSKKYFAEKFRRENLTGCIYENYPLTDISQIQQLILKETDLQGLNVTIPYKSSIFRFLDYTEPEAREIGAVNVLKIRRPDGIPRLYGFNSDITGITDSIVPYIKGKTMNALILGTGGSSLAVCHVLKKLGIKFTLVSRNKKPGILTYSDLNSNLIKSTGLIINTTPLGMFPDIESKPELNYGLLESRHILFDLVYNPEFTAFLRMGIEKGCTTITGIRMLHSQAEKSWEIWNDDRL